MPIPPELRSFYRASVWRPVRNRILKRAGGKFDDAGNYIGGAHCEHCGAPDRQVVERGRAGAWRSLLSARWHDCRGLVIARHLVERPLRELLIILTVAHLDHDPSHNTDDNLAAMCQWCHLHYDAPHHKETRSARKDAARPLLAPSREA